MSIFDRLIDEHKDKFSRTRMYGVSISDLSGDALRACICMLGEKENRDRETRQSERENMKLFLRRGW